MEFHNHTVIPTCNLIYIYYFNHKKIYAKPQKIIYICLLSLPIFKKHLNEPANINLGPLLAER